MDIVIEVLNMDLLYYIYIVASIILMVFAVLMYVGIKQNGKIIIIDQLFKKKDFDRIELQNRYTIQAIYTFIIGVALLVIMLTIPFDGVKVFLSLLVFGVLDFLYDYVAIKSSTRT